MTSSSDSSSASSGLTLGKLIAGIGIVLLLILSLFMVKVHTVHGNEIGVLESWSGGVSPDPLPPKTYVFFPGFNKTVYDYTTSGQVFVMNDKAPEEEPLAHGRRVDPLVVNSLDNQQVTFHITVTWHIDSLHVVNLHKQYRDSIEERLIRPEIANEVSIRATLQNAIDLYSGPKLNALRDLVNSELRSPTGRLALSGVVVDRFIIERPHLNPQYEQLIEQRQLAIATESQAKEQARANQALADSARIAALKQQYEEVVAAQTIAQKTVIDQQAASDKATIQTKADALNTITSQEAQARVVVINAKASAEQTVVKAQADAENAVTIQKAQAQTVVINAKAEADRRIAISEAAKQAEINRSVGIKAVGAATAEANKLLLSSYAVPGSENYTRIQVAGELAHAFEGVRYYPSSMSMSVISTEFAKGLSVLTPSAPTQ